MSLISGTLVFNLTRTMKDNPFLLKYLHGNTDPNFSLKDKLSLEKLLKKRASKLNNNFEMTVDVIKKFTQLNNILFDTENQIFDACIKIESDILNEHKWNYSITDYEIDINIVFYSNEIIEANKEIEIDYLWRSTSILSFVKPHMVEFGLSKTNWINFQRDYGHCFSVWNKFNLDNFTRSFYELCNNSPLAYEDILKIDNIWWDIDVSYQFNKQFKL